MKVRKDMTDKEIIERLNEEIEQLKATISKMETDTAQEDDLK